MLKLSGLSDILECYHENVYANQDAYYFFDEIQYATDWDKWLKTIYDMQPETKFVLESFKIHTCLFPNPALRRIIRKVTRLYAVISHIRQ